MPRIAKMIWITRAEPGATATAIRVRKLGHIPIVVPLLQVRPIETTDVDLAGVGALAFTSANGVRSFAAMSTARDLPVYAVGVATAAAARSEGFSQILSADGDVKALAAGIASRRANIDGYVLHPSAMDPAGDLVGDLAAQGIDAKALEIYESIPFRLSPELLASVAEAEMAILHSPKAAKELAALLRRAPQPKLRVLGLSKAVLAPLSRAKIASKSYAPFPLEAALLSLIDRTP